MFKYETSKFSKHLLYMSIDLNVGKAWTIECLVNRGIYSFSDSHGNVNKGQVALEQIQIFPIFDDEKIGKNFASSRFCQ